MSQSVQNQCKHAYEVSPEMGVLSTGTKNEALLKMADALVANQDVILKENKKDLADGQKAGISKALLDRLALTSDRIEGMAGSLREIVALSDPIGETVEGFTRPNGLKITKVRVPLGVIGIIYEARPNVTCDAISLAVKTGNCVVLRGSASAYQSNRAIADTLSKAGVAAGLPDGCIQLLEDTTRESVRDFIRMNQYLSMVIPRGGGALIKHVWKMPRCQRLKPVKEIVMSTLIRRLI